METFNEVITSSPIVVLEIYARHCSHCTLMEPVVNDVSLLTGPTVNIYQLDVDENPELAEMLDIEGTPTFFIFKEGIEVWRWTGEIDGNTLLSKIQSFE